MAFVDSPSPPIASLDPLVAYLAEGGKPRAQWRVGTEHEKFGFRRTTLAPIPYHGEDGIHALLEGMRDQFGWTPTLEAGQPIALTRGEAAITLEPAGQVELSGAPLPTIHAAQGEINEHLHQLGAVCRSLGIAFMGAGFNPLHPREALPWMPKGRYAVMRAYLPTRGDMALDMMTRTATVQANLDFDGEADMVRKMRLALALQPLVTALFANSPFCEGRPAGFWSLRAEAWRRTDPDRCGWLPFAFQPGFGFARYAEYALDVPMFFVYRQGRYLPADGLPFRAFLEGRLPALPGERPTLEDWKLHLSTLFPEVRLKHYLEMRGADAGDSATLCALPALWKGLFHDDQALEAVWELVADWSLEERERIWRQVPRLALETPIPGSRTFRELALQVLDWSRAGLVNQGALNANGCDESVYLKPLFRTAESGLTPAHRLLQAYHERWEQNVAPLFREKEFESFYAECG
ncbi:MAG: glutamate--cysteine ligase [Magnetococcales bacterium]|nr:glutamate--cysteine ligase [Magnetococcales bacterium]